MGILPSRHACTHCNTNLTECKKELVVDTLAVNDLIETFIEDKTKYEDDEDKRELMHLYYVSRKNYHTKHSVNVAGGRRRTRRLRRLH